METKNFEMVIEGSHRRRWRLAGYCILNGIYRESVAFRGLVALGILSIGRIEENTATGALRILLHESETHRSWEMSKLLSVRERTIFHIKS